MRTRRRWARVPIAHAIAVVAAVDDGDGADGAEYRQVLGPPEVEAGIGLTGGHIFQGECFPDQMWDRRFGPGTPMPGVHPCGAATHPGGGVSAIKRPQRGHGRAPIWPRELTLEQPQTYHTGNGGGRA